MKKIHFDFFNAPLCQRYSFYPNQAQTLQLAKNDGDVTCAHCRRFLKTYARKASVIYYASENLTKRADFIPGCGHPNDGERG
jgi:hypothetical protein